ncbi:MAG: hypothetical protein RMN24_04370 [Anaerolineae bacterium]|nr:hypothetical protein [Anaerolineae bacterium]
MLAQITAITGVGARYWEPFQVTSPGGIPFAGYVCRQESEKLGMLAVIELAGQERLEFIAGMPKIPYPYRSEGEGRPQLVIPVPSDIVDARFTLKLDGTAILFYALKDTDGRVLEVIPRTRLQPVLTASRWGDWWALLHAVLPDRSPVEQAVRVEDVVLVFELWGARNPHLVRYETPLALTLHTGIRQYRPISFLRLRDLAERYGFDLVPTLEVAEPHAEGLAQAYRRWQERMETANQEAAARVGPGTFVQEGTVLILSTVETAIYYKCKPPSIEEIHWTTAPSLSKPLILQTLHKMLENGYDFAGGRPEDVQAILAAEFDPHEVTAATDLIARTWTEFVTELERRERLRRLVEASGLDVSDLPNLMRHLAAYYPRHEMGWVYATVKRLYGL